MVARSVVRPEGAQDDKPNLAGSGCEYDEATGAKHRNGNVRTARSAGDV